MQSRLDSALSADRHEDGGRDIAVGGVENSGARPGFGAFGEEFKGDLAGQVFILVVSLSLMIQVLMILLLLPMMVVAAAPERGVPETLAAARDCNLLTMTLYGCEGSLFFDAVTAGREDERSTQPSAAG